MKNDPLFMLMVSAKILLSEVNSYSFSSRTFFLRPRFFGALSLKTGGDVSMGLCIDGSIVFFVIPAVAAVSLFLI